MCDDARERESTVNAWDSEGEEDDNDYDDDDSDDDIQI